MLKKILVLLALSVFMSAVATYLVKRNRLLKSSERVLIPKEPAIVVEGFTVDRFDGDQLMARFGGHTGYFYEPNVFEVYGDIYGVRYLSQNHERVSSESAKVEFAAAEFTQVLNNTQVKKVEVWEFVEVKMRDYLLMTDYAEFNSDNNEISSRYPVRVESTQRWFSGEDGFRYGFANEELKIFGNVRGTIGVN